MKKVIRITLCVFAIILVAYAVLWFQSRRTYPVALGISFSHKQADWLGFYWHNVYRDMLKDLQPEFIRLSAFWDDVEKEQGKYRFEDLDWMMNEAKKSNTKVLLVVGQKQPRWPECHIPGWVATLPVEKRQEYLLVYVKKVVERYKDNTALELWQVENEPFIHFDFGECAAFDETMVEKEAQLVRSLDSEHFIVVTDSGELGLWKRAKNMADIFGTTLYRVVLSRGGRTITYDWMPPAVYRLKAYILGIPYERFFVAELQAEPWLEFANPRTVSLEDQKKTLNPERLQKNISYAKHVGASRAYLWGVEWWYWMKEHKSDPTYWNMIKEAIAESKKETQLNTKGQY